MDELSLVFTLFSTYIVKISSVKIVHFVD